MLRKFFSSLRPRIPKKTYALMIVPHNQKSVKTYRVTSRMLYLVFSLVIFITLFSLMSITRYIYLSFKETSVKSENEEMIKKVERLVYNSNRIIKNQKEFSNVFNKLLSTMGLSGQIFYSEATSIGGPFISPNPKQLEENKVFKEIEEIKELKALENKMNTIDSAIKKVVRRIKRYERVTKYIPSIWPLIGEGEIIKNRNGVLTIRTDPYTPVVATAKGKVIRISVDNNLLRITLRHRYNFISVYSNIYSIPEGVKENSVVKKGEIIGYVGKDVGRSYLLYAVYIGNERGIVPVNAEEFSYLGRK